MIDMLFKGVGWTDIAFLLNRVAVGMFSSSPGYHYLFNAPRHRMFTDELKACTSMRLGSISGGSRSSGSAGGAVVIGLLAPLAALGLIVIILVACATSGRQRIKTYKPIGRADRIDDWLYLPETLYAFMLLLIVSAGAGPYSVDSVIVGLMR